ncbi:MAG: hypothetical protein JSW51_06205 [Gemmatimonadota bacterium]|nr:MAG: hypothetical protein JSW51_06205 [Gemmatimonadota bacterium]
MVLAACNPITGNSDDVIALVIEGLPERTLEVGDTLTLIAKALTFGGDTVPDAEITWVVVGPDTGQLGFSLDTLSGLVTAYAPGSGFVRPRLEDLTTRALIEVTVTPPADSIAPAGGQRLTMGATDSISPQMSVAVFQIDSLGAPVALGEKPVHFYLVDPLPGSASAAGFYVTTDADSSAGSEPHEVVSISGTDGQATAVIKLGTDSSLPDSAVVDAVAVTAVGDTVTGSPVRFTVLFGGDGPQE